MSKIYICDSAPELRIKIRGTKMKFKDKKLELENKADIEFLDNLLKRSSHAQAVIRVLNIEAAEAIAREHREKMLAQNAAHKGMGTSMMEDAKKQQIQDELLAKVDMDDPKTAAAVKALIEEDPNATLLEKPDLERVVEAQKAKIAEELAAKEKAEEDSKAAEQSGNKPQFSLKNLAKKEN